MREGLVNNKLNLGRYLLIISITILLSSYTHLTLACGSADENGCVVDGSVLWQGIEYYYHCHKTQQ